MPPEFGIAPFADETVWRIAGARAARHLLDDWPFVEVRLRGYVIYMTVCDIARAAEDAEIVAAFRSVSRDDAHAATPQVQA
ncbi:hypothetical protein [Bradyrhizobium sp. 162]|nr:hypothetical protein [Bradyrhizobium sp. 162]MCK1634671.1 hypothetical protein [Bradyrhizobium sp. 162]